MTSTRPRRPRSSRTCKSPVLDDLPALGQPLAERGAGRLVQHPDQRLLGPVVAVGVEADGELPDRLAQAAEEAEREGVRDLVVPGHPPLLVRERVVALVAQL